MRKSLAFLFLLAAALVLRLPSPATAQTKEPDFGTLAHRIITTSVAVRPGEVVLIEGGKHTIPLMEALAIEAQKAGGMVSMLLDSDRVIRSMEMEVPERYLGQEPGYLPAWFGQVDVYINLPPASDIKALDAGVSARRLGMIAKASEFITPRLDGMKFRELSIIYPTTERGTGFKLSGATYVNMIWGAVGADYAQIAAKGTALKQMLQQGKTVRVTSPAGTDVTFSLAKRPVFLSDGIITAKQAKGKRFTDRSAGLPDGTVSVAPLEASANGKVVAPRAACRFLTMTDVSFSFAGGKMTNLKASKGLQCYKEGVAASSGPTEVFGGLSIGLNPAWKVHEENGAAYYPASGAGVVFLAVGDDQLLGGTNKTGGNYGFTFPIKDATVWIDGKKIVDKGALTI